MHKQKGGRLWWRRETECRNRGLTLPLAELEWGGSPGPQSRSRHRSEWNPDVTKSLLQMSVVPTTWPQVLERRPRLCRKKVSHIPAPL